MRATSQLCSIFFVLKCFLVITTDSGTVATMEPQTATVAANDVTGETEVGGAWTTIWPPLFTSTASMTDLTFSQLLAIVCLSVILLIVIALLCGFCFYIRGHKRKRAKLLKHMESAPAWSAGQEQNGNKGHKIIQKKATKLRNPQVSWDPQYNMGENYIVDSDPYHVGPIPGGHPYNRQPVEEDFGQDGPIGGGHPYGQGGDFDPFSQGEHFDPFGQGREPFNPYVKRH